MAEIKISISERMNDIIREISDFLGIKRSEFVKNLVVNDLEDYKGGKRKNEGKK